MIYVCLLRDKKGGSPLDDAVRHLHAVIQVIFAKMQVRQDLDFFRVSAQGLRLLRKIKPFCYFNSIVFPAYFAQQRWSLGYCVLLCQYV